ncbi:MAG: hypothetical protein DRJ50_02795 [Actinobacteria bacterium]|nr:MAG: hypothetical protein DRJ50_02795 [Actinomycetota bacterium]
MTTEAANLVVQRRGAFRHHKQRFDPEADFVWRKRRLLGGGVYSAPGDPVDKAVFNASKIRMLWKTSDIELADAPTTSKRRPVVSECEVDLQVIGKGHYTLTLTEPGDGGKVHSYSPRGLGNLIRRATELGIRELVENLAADLKAESKAKVEEESADEGELGDAPDPSDKTEPATFGEGDSGVLDGGGDGQGTVVPVGSLPLNQ